MKYVTNIPIYILHANKSIRSIHIYVRNMHVYIVHANIFIHSIHIHIFPCINLIIYSIVFYSFMKMNYYIQRSIQDIKVTHMIRNNAHSFLCQTSLLVWRERRDSSSHLWAKVLSRKTYFSVFENEQGYVSRFSVFHTYTYMCKYLNVNVYIF